MESNWDSSGKMASGVSSFLPVSVNLNDSRARFLIDILKLEKRVIDKLIELSNRGLVLRKTKTLNQTSSSLSS